MQVLARRYADEFYGASRYYSFRNDIVRVRVYEGANGGWYCRMTGATFTYDFGACGTALRAYKRAIATAPFGMPMPHEKLYG